jgi:ACT domain-containing protein
MEKNFQGVIMKAVITVVGKDTVGILAKVSALCAECGANIIDVTQTVMQEMFCMIMLCETETLSVPFADFVDRAENLGEENNLKIHVMHEDLFNSMHRI